MDISDLSDWVAVKDDIFTVDHENEKAKFICGWNKEEGKLAIIYHEGNRKASDNWEKNKAALLTISELYGINKQLSLIEPSIKNTYPSKLKPNNVFVSQLFTNRAHVPDSLLRSVEHYLYDAKTVVGTKLLLSLLFQEDNSFDNYEESIQEYTLRKLENDVNNQYNELASVLAYRERAGSLLEMKTIYQLEDGVISNIVSFLSELYNFQLRPFIELRELAHTKLTEAKKKLNEEIGPRIRKLANESFEEWNEQYLAASEALQQLYQDYYRKVLLLIEGQRDRMLTDQGMFGKASFSVHALPRLQRLEIQVCKEKLKLLNAIKATKEFQRDRIQQQFSFVEPGINAASEIKRIEAEVYDAQKNILDSTLEVLDVEERLYKMQLTIMNREYLDSLDTDIFYEAVETIDELEDLDCDSPPKDPKIVPLKERLNRLYRKRANIRNKKKAILAEERKRNELEVQTKEKEKRNLTIKRPEKKVNVRELPADKISEERKKTLQRLRAYKKKNLHQTNKYKPECETLDDVEDVAQPDGAAYSIDFVRGDKQKSIKGGEQSVCKSAEQVGNVTVGFSTNRTQIQTTALPKQQQKSQALPPPPPPPPPPSLLLPPPPPPPPPPSLLPPPPPPPPPSLFPPVSSNKPGNIPIQMPVLAITAENVRNLKKPDLKDLKATPVQSFNLEEILSIRSKLRKPSLDNNKSETELNNSVTDFSALLRSTMKRVRNMTSDSDTDSAVENESDFD